MTTVICMVVLACIAFSRTIVAAQGDDKGPLQVPRAASEIVIDGAVDEPAWNDALHFSLNYEVRPAENTAPPARTEVFITYDDNRVLVAFRAFDPDPEKIRARYHDRDRMWPDDWVGIVLDTFNDERRAYEFMTNPLGVQTDAVNDDVQKKFDPSWDAIWKSAGRLTATGYEVEMAIPFNQIRFQSVEGPQIWGVDAIRSYPRSDRHHLGLFPRERGVNSYLAQAVKIEGFESATPGKNLEIVPTLTVIDNQQLPDFPDSDEEEESTDTELGATVRWGMTPNLTLSAALNPDFSQVEADAARLQINEQFTLFYPEARPFFLESADYFNTKLNLLYTRMVADPSAALKLTGKSGRHTYGIFSATDEITNVMIPGNEGSDSDSFEASNVATVARYRYDFGLNSTVGAMVTDREGEDGYFNLVVSADAHVRFTEADTLTANIAWSETAYSDEMVDEFELDVDDASGHAFEAEFVHSARSWFSFVEIADRDEGFRADLGFLPRVDIRQIRGGGGLLLWGGANDWFNKLELAAAARTTDDQDDNLVSRGAAIWLEYGGPLQSEFEIRLSGREQVYDGVRFDNMIIPRFRASFRPTAQIRLEAGGRFGDWIDFDNVRPATRVNLDSEIDLNLGRHFSAGLDYTYSTLDVEGGRLFTAHVPQAKIVWQFNTRAFLRAIAQYTDVERNLALYNEPEDYDEISRDLFLQLLFSYELNPRTVLFLGYSESGFENQDYSRTLIDRTLFLKLGYAFVW